MILTFKTRALFDGRTLPVFTELGAHEEFYELKIVQEGRVLARAPFSKDTSSPIEIHLFGEQDVIDPAYCTCAHVARVRARVRIQVHLYKIRWSPTIKRYQFIRRITDATSARQDEPIYDGCVAHTPSPLFTVRAHAQRTTFVPKDMMDIEGGSLRWCTQRNFYSTSHVTQSDGAHLENLVLMREFLHTHKHTHLLPFVQEYGTHMTYNRIEYTHDEGFARPMEEADAGDALVEQTHVGDCEDFAHFYMRVFRTLALAGPLIKRGDALLEILRKAYVPFVYICQVRIYSGLEYHSTLMLVPRARAHAPLSFEVTNPAKSYLVRAPTSEFFKWHTKSFLLVDAHFIANIERESVRDLSVQTLKLMNY